MVDKLLTGFDAPRNIVLYIARSLKEHSLLQAIARVNRLHPGKDFGYIIDYYGVVAQLHEALELYSALEGLFDPEDLEGTLTDVAEELKRLPGLHDAMWDIFREIRNKKDEEAFELALEKPERRDEFYTKLSKFCRVLKMALASIHWVRTTPAATSDRYKRDALFFQKLRASVKIRYAEEVDYREYETQIQKMLTTYVQADEVIQMVEPVNIFEREAFENEVDKARSPRAKADTIANRTKKTITEKMEEDPFFYRKFSVLLEETIADYEAHRISEVQYLEKVTEIMRAVRDGRANDAVRDLLAVELDFQVESDEESPSLTFAEYLRLMGIERPTWYGPRCLVTAMILHHFGDHQAMHDVLQGSGRRFKGPAAAYRQLLLGIAAAGLGKTDKARTSMTKALELASACDSNQVAGETKIALGRLEASCGRTDAAENLLLQAGMQLGELGTGRESALAMVELAELLHRQGRTEDALEAVDSALGNAAEQGLLDVECRANELFLRMGYQIR